MLLPFGLGLTSLSTQIILLREFMVLFNGNEMVIGIVLANWMLLTGLGAWLGRFYHPEHKDLKGIQEALFLLAFLAPLTLFLSDWLRNHVFIPGSLAGIDQVFYFSLLILLPFCLLSGFLFTRLSNYISGLFQRNAAAEVYSRESLGSLAGGILVNFILIFLLSPFQSLLVIFILNALITGIVEYPTGEKTTLVLAGLTALFMTGFVLFFHPDQLSREFLFPKQEIVYYKDTPYGNLLVTKSAGQMNFFGNNSLLFTTDNSIDNEEAVHYAMLQRIPHKNILLIEGGISGVLREILKYPVKHIDYIEINPWIIQLGEKYAPEMLNPAVHVTVGDAKRFLQQTGRQYDAVLFQVPEPSTLQADRYYTLEFLSLLKTRLSPGAVISLSLMPAQNYLGDEALRAQACMLSTLKEVFAGVLVIPGEKNYFLASDSLLRCDMARLADERKIPTVYVNAYIILQAAELLVELFRTNKRVFTFCNFTFIVSLVHPDRRYFSRIVCHRVYGLFARNPAAFCIPGDLWLYVPDGGNPDHSFHGRHNGRGSHREKNDPDTRL